jgi:hypothetical protein
MSLSQSKWCKVLLALDSAVRNRFRDAHRIITFIIERNVAYFLADDSPVPAPTTTVGGKWGPIFLPKEMMGQWVDLLRNEQPLFGYINTDHPEWTNLSSSEEPVGEEEA